MVPMQKWPADPIATTQNCFSTLRRYSFLGSSSSCLFVPLGRILKLEVRPVPQMGSSSFSGGFIVSQQGSGDVRTDITLDTVHCILKLFYSGSIDEASQSCRLQLTYTLVYYSVNPNYSFKMFSL